MGLAQHVTTLCNKWREKIAESTTSLTLLPPFIPVNPGQLTDRHNLTELAQVGACVYVCTCVHESMYVSVCACKNMHVCVCMIVCKKICLYVCVDVCIYMSDIRFILLYSDFASGAFYRDKKVLFCSCDCMIQHRIDSWQNQRSFLLVSQVRPARL